MRTVIKENLYARGINNDYLFGAELILISNDLR